MNIENSSSICLRTYAPFAFPRGFIPWHKDVILFNRHTFSGEFFAYLGEESLEFRVVDDGNTVNDERIIEAAVVIDFVSINLLQQKAKEVVNADLLGFDIGVVDILDVVYVLGQARHLEIFL